MISFLLSICILFTCVFYLFVVILVFEYSVLFAFQILETFIDLYSNSKNC